MKVSAFDFDLPDRLIAQTPVTPRDSAKLLAVRDGLSLHTVADLPDFLQEGDVLVLNNSKVIPARLFGQVGEKQLEILLHKALDAKSSATWQAFARPGKKLKIGGTIRFAGNIEATVLEKLPSGEAILQFSVTPEAFRRFLFEHGQMPLPPYIHRDGKPGQTDEERYQTIYANPEGSVAAPTAGLHFTESLMERLKAKNIAIAFVTLHVGAGTFQPVKTEDTAEHVMHSEWGEVGAEAAAAINAAKAKGGRVICVGTTSLRVLESAVAADGALAPWQGDTAIFITPGYRFKIADMLMTNFHLPKSTLFMLVSAFSGLEQMQAAYRFAIEKGLRFYSYGDATLLYRAS